MAASSGVMESIVILDDDEEEEEQFHPQPSSSSPPPPTSVPPTHITQSPFASSKKESHILQLENQKLFEEFVEHCTAHTQDHPEVITFLQCKHTKASPDFLASVEFRNTLGRCLTRAQACHTKTFVYINELCTVLKQHSVKRRQPVTAMASAAEGGPGAAEQPEEGRPTSPGPEEQKTAPKASRRQMVYLENLLKVYDDEIQRLQEKEISLEDLEDEDSSYIQEHKLKRKMMKIYEKLCELKGCSTLTGRVIEQKVQYTGTRYPEINKKIERFINSPESRQNPPDYSDILQVVRRTNERYGLSLSHKQVTQIAQDAFRETGNRLQDRRHLDMVYNFGCHLTDMYKPASDPALSDSTLARKLRSNRELAMNRIEEVIVKYSLKQEDTEEEERRKRQEKKKEKEPNGEPEGMPAEVEMKDEEEDEECASEREGAESEGQEDEEDDDDDDDEEEEVSSDPDIEEELEASQSQEGAEGGEEEAVVTNDSDKEEHWGSGPSSSPEAVNMNGEEDSQSASSCQEHVSDGDPLRVKPEEKDEPTPPVSPNQSEVLEPDKSLLAVSAKRASCDHSVTALLTSGAEACLPSSCLDTKTVACSPVMANADSLPSSPATILPNQDSVYPLHGSRSAGCSPLPPSPQAIKMTQVSKRRTIRSSEEGAINGRYKRTRGDSDDDIPLDMGVVSSSPPQADSTCVDSPFQELVSSSQYTPPPKKNKVNVATQCDPDEVIVLSDSD